MKTAIAFFLTFSLTVAILAPSLNIILNLDSNKIVLDLNEEEESSNQQIKEIKEKQLCVHSYKNDVAFFTLEQSLFRNSDIEINASNSVEVSIPPPKV